MLSHSIYPDNDTEMIETRWVKPTMTVSKYTNFKIISSQSHYRTKIFNLQDVTNRAMKGKAIPLQALTGPEGSRRLKLVDFNPLTPELNPSAQRCLTRIFTGDFAS
jgi:hypothetical protein